MALPNEPITRQEMYLSNIAGQNTALPEAPITREEMYLDYIAKNGGTGEGDMKKSIYDSDTAVATAGGIKMFVNQKIGTLPQRVGSLETTAGVLQGEVVSIENTLGNLGTASTKNSTSVVTESSDLVESGAVKNIVGWGNANNLPPVIWHLNNISSFDGSDGDGNPMRTRTTPAFAFPFPSQTFEISGLPSCITELNGVKCFDSAKTEIGMAQVNGYKFTTLANTAYVYILLNGENITVADMANALIMVCREGKTPSSYEPYHASVEDYCASKQDVINTVGWCSTVIDKGVLASANVNNEGVINDSSYSLAYFKVQAGKKYTVSNCNDFTDANLILAYFTEKPVQRAVSYNNSRTQIARGTAISQTVTAPIDGYIVIRMNNSTDNIRFEVGEVVTQSVEDKKCDNSVIAPVENGSTASQAYAVGEHFIRDGAFCTCTQAISQGGSFTLNTNYTAGDVADELTPIDITSEFTFSSSIVWNTDWTYIVKIGNTIRGSLRFTTPSQMTMDLKIVTVPTKYKPKINKSLLLSPLFATWSGEVKGLMTMSALPSYDHDIFLASTNWITNTNVITSFEYVLI